MHSSLGNKSKTPSQKKKNDVIAHCLLVFSILGPPKIIKTDNASAYTSKGFKHFCSPFGIQHRTGIPYNPQGQGIVESAHAILKLTLQKIKKGKSGADLHRTPHIWLRHALYVLNFLTFGAEGCSAA